MARNQLHYPKFMFTEGEVLDEKIANYFDDMTSMPSVGWMNLDLTLTYDSVTED